MAGYSSTVPEDCYLYSSAVDARLQRGVTSPSKTTCASAQFPVDLLVASTARGACTEGLLCSAMSAWKSIETAEPEFAARVRQLFDSGRHKTIATLRADGSPRISGIECEFVEGELRFGSMSGSRKGADLHRDARFALHSPSSHPGEGKDNEWTGESKVAGRAIAAGRVTSEGEEGPDGEMFVADITEVVVTGLNAEATMLVIESWTPDGGLRRVERA